MNRAKMERQVTPKAPAIIRCGCLFFFTGVRPTGSTSILMGDANDLIFGDGYFLLVVSSKDPLRPADEADLERARVIIESAWRTLYASGCVKDPAMPAWIHGEPDMMRLSLGDLSPHQANIFHGVRD